MGLNSVFDVVPGGAARPLTIAASVAAVGGAALVLLATVYGDWIPAAWAAGVFAVAGVLWHAGDRASNR